MSTSHRREQLLAAAATGTLGADEQAELDALLREDPQAREELEALRDDARRLDAWHAPAGEGWLAAEPSAALDARVASVAGPGPSGSDHDGRRSMGGARRGRLVLAAALLVLAVGLLAWQVGGGRLLALAVFSLGFLLLNGIWPPAMLSIYLCFVAVVICILLGGVIGIWAASSDVVSQVIRPINDMLQTLPQFVFLIPALMLFQVGDFTALLAVVAYAIVPMIRYTEHGLRSVPRPLIEAGVSSGCSPWQMFWQIRLPLAQAQILIGINQTILYALGMLVIAALVGTTDLGQAIYIALGKANAGAGLVAGLGMALIAMTADRILQAVIRSGR